MEPLRDVLAVAREASDMGTDVFRGSADHTTRVTEWTPAENDVSIFLRSSTSPFSNVAEAIFGCSSPVIRGQAADTSREVCDEMSSALEQAVAQLQPRNIWKEETVKVLLWELRERVQRSP